MSKAGFRRIMPEQDWLEAEREIVEELERGGE